MIESTPTAAFIITVLIAVGAQLIAARFKFPPIIIWLIAGMLLGNYGLHFIHAELLEGALHTLVELGLAVILFEGGLNLNLKTLREHGWTVGRLVLVAPLMTMMIGGAAVHYLIGMDWAISLLFGALVAVGGPTVILPIVRQVRLDREVSHILSSEAMLVDAVGAILAIVMLQIVLTPELDTWLSFQDIMVKFAVGTCIGVLGGWLLGLALKHNIAEGLELRVVLSLAAAWGIFLLANELSSQAGLMAVLVAGVVLQRMSIPDLQSLKHFKGSLSMLLISVLFVLLAANLNLHVMEMWLWQGVLIFIVLALFVRPLAVWCSSIGGTLNMRQVAFLGLMAPRGVVAAGVTSLFSLVLLQAGHPHAETLLALVYIIIIVSVFVYSLLAKPLSRWLDVAGGSDRSVLIVGGGQVGAELGRLLSEDREVRFLDLNGQVVRNLKRAGFEAVQGNGLDPLYMEVIHAEEIDTIIVMTGSSDHNLHIARLAQEQFHIRETYVALEEDEEKKYTKLIHQLQARRLFAKPYTFSYWHDQAVRKRLVFEHQKVEADSPLVGLEMQMLRIPHGVQPLAVVRAGKSWVMHDTLVLEEDDEVYFLLRPERMQEGQALLQPPSN
ncbi:MAG: cation:proton antiporter [Mariprofundaceae bacterium]|nr:cation:proton antiporter [Mariprofundaceae bacterium]